MSNTAAEEVMSGEIPGLETDIDIRKQETEDVVPIRQVNGENTATSATADDGNKPLVEPEDIIGVSSAVGIEQGHGSDFLEDGGEWIAEEGVVNKTSRVDEEFNGVGGDEDMCRHLSQFAVSAINEASLHIDGK